MLILQLIVIDNPEHSQNGFQTASLHDDTPNADSFQRDPKRPKTFVDPEHYNSL